MPFYAVCFQNYIVKTFKSSWIDGSKLAESKNNGIKPYEQVKIFHSNHPYQKADFSLELEDCFDEEKTGCYIGYLLAVFG